MENSFRGHLWPCWSELTDGLCEHVAVFLPRNAQLACRLVCRAWRTSFAHSFSALTLDTSFFRTQPLDTTGTTRDAHADEAMPPADMPPEWHSLTAAIGPALRSITVRVSLLHYSKPSGTPWVASCLACIHFLAALPRHEWRRLQLVLPLRCEFPRELADTLTSRLGQLYSLRLVRCSLTQQVAATIGGMTQLRHLCIAHATLAALPQLLQRATHLEHIHVHGYHSLVIMDNNPHMRAVWAAASELVERSLGCNSRVDEDHGANGGSGIPVGTWLGGGTGPSVSTGNTESNSSRQCRGRLRCLAISAHYLDQESVLDESDLNFEADALQWQIRFDSSSPSPDAVDTQSGRWPGPIETGPGPLHGESPSTSAVLHRVGKADRGPSCRRLGGCWRDVHEDAGPGTSRGTTAARHGTYAGGGSGCVALCAAALLDIRCPCCCHDDDIIFSNVRSSHHQPPPVSSVRNAAHEAAPSRLRSEAGCHINGAVDTEGRGAITHGAATAAATATAARDDANAAVAMQAAAVAIPAEALSFGGAGSLAEAAGLQLLESAKRCVQLSREQLLEAISHPDWRHLQYVQLKLRPPPQPQPQHLSPLPLTLEPLTRLPTLRAIWIAPEEREAEGEWQEQEEKPHGILEPVMEAMVEGQEGLTVAVTPAPGAGAGAGAGAAEITAAASNSTTGDRGRHPTRWVRVGYSWTPLYELPSGSGGTSGALRVRVLDTAAHAALLVPLTGLRSLALGRWRRDEPSLLVLGVGDDTAALLCRLAGLTKLHLHAAYTLPLEDGALPAAQLSMVTAATRRMVTAATAAGTGRGEPVAAPVQSPRLPSWMSVPPRLAPLGALTALQRLALHFSNRQGRPAVISHAALPSSLTSLSLYGIILVPPLAVEPCSDGAAQEAAMGAQDANKSGLHLWSMYGSAFTAAVLPHAVPSLECLRELSLASSYIADVDRLGCGPCLRILSLRDSGLQVTSTRQGSGAQAAALMNGSDLVDLLRTWHAVQTLRVHGSTTTSKDVQLPTDEYCLDWHSTAGLYAITACLPGLRQLHLAPPQPYNFLPPESAATDHRRHATALTEFSLEPSGLPELPDWRLTHCGNTELTSAAASMGADATTTAGVGDGGSAGNAPPVGMKGKLQQDILTEERGSEERGGGGACVYDGGETSAALQGSGLEKGTEWPDVGSAFASPSPSAATVGLVTAEHELWLLTLLHLLCRYTPHLESLMLSCTLANQSGADRMVRSVRELLPGRLLHLDSLSLVLGVSLSSLLDEPYPKVAARKWAEALRNAKWDIQARMPYTCVALTPDPMMNKKLQEAILQLGLQAAYKA